MTATITVADLATELSVSVRTVTMHVSHLCREQGHATVVHTATSSNARSILHNAAADLIRARYTNATR